MIARTITENIKKKKTLVTMKVCLILKENEIRYSFPLLLYVFLEIFDPCAAERPLPQKS